MEDVFEAAIPDLLAACRNNDERPIVKHEILVSLGDMVQSKELLVPFLTSDDLIVSQSAEVALSYCENRGIK